VFFELLLDVIIFTNGVLPAQHFKFMDHYSTPHCILVISYVYIHAMDATYLCTYVRVFFSSIVDLYFVFHFSINV